MVFLVVSGVLPVVLGVTSSRTGLTGYLLDHPWPSVSQLPFTWHRLRALCTGGAVKSFQEGLRAD